MAYLIIKRDGKEKEEILLNHEKQYILGRSQKCDILLEKVKGLSREHLKIYFQNEEGMWKVERLSQTGVLIQDGNSIESLVLEENSTFSIPPYHFLFRNEKEEEENKDPVQLEEKNEDEVQEKPNEEKVESNEEGFLDQKNNLENLAPFQKSKEKKEDLEQFKASATQTLARIPEIHFSLKIKPPSPYPKKTLTLNTKEKKEWIAGRDKKCDIQIEDKKVSRKHFKIHLKEDFFQIEDLKSANGTFLGKKKVLPQILFPLSKDDVISIGKTEIKVEIKNTLFSLQLENLERNRKENPDPFFSSFNLNERSGLMDDASSRESDLVKAKNSKVELLETNVDPLASLAHDDQKKQKKSQKFTFLNLFRRDPSNAPLPQKKKKKTLFLLVAVVLIGLSFFLLDDSFFSGEKNSKQSLSSHKKNEQLSQDLERAQEIFVLARKNFMEGKYELCSFELRKLHKIVKEYENSKELETLCLQAFDLKRMEEEKERQEKERLVLEKKFNAIVEDCKSKLKEKTTSSELKECLAPALEINPSSPLVSDLIFELKLKEKQRQEKEEAKARKKARIQRGVKLYKKAEKFHKEGEIKKAVKAYKNFIESSIPDPYKNKEKARKNLQSIIEDHNKKIESLLENCRSTYKNSQFKKSFYECDKVLKQIKENEEALELKNKALFELKKKTKNLYIDSVLEESVGNLESAINKWETIIKDSVPGDEYYERSKRKLEIYKNRF